VFEEMNQDDKNFMTGWFNSLKEQIDKLEIHQVKTCDELDTVDKNVVQLSADLKNHLDIVNKEEADKLELQKSSREKQAIRISTISVSVAVISVVAVFVVTSL